MARILSVCGKTSDRCITVLRVDGEVVKETDGYVPDIVPGSFGDYIELDIDIDTGQIVNWKKPTEKELKAYMKIGE